MESSSASRNVVTTAVLTFARAFEAASRIATGSIFFGRRWSVEAESRMSFDSILRRRDGRAQGARAAVGVVQHREHAQHGTVLQQIEAWYVGLPPDRTRPV